MYKKLIHNKMKTITKEEAITWMEEAIENNIVFGLRGDIFVPEEQFNNSTVWDDGNKTDEILDGLCAIKVDRIKNIEWALSEVKKYGTDFFIVIGESEVEGDDDNEIVIMNHRIYAKID